jgi:hypothetical protein
MPANKSFIIIIIINLFVFFCFWFTLSLDPSVLGREMDEVAMMRKQCHSLCWIEELRWFVFQALLSCSLSLSLLFPVDERRGSKPIDLPVCSLVVVVDL